MSLLYLAGPRFNHVEWATITASPAADSLFPTTYLADRIPGQAFKFGSLTAAPSIVFDLDLLGGTGGFESWSSGTPVGWTEANTGVGHVDENVGGPAVYEGSRSAEFDNDDGGAAFSSIYKDVTCRPGQNLTLTSALYDSSAAFGAIQITLRNQDTGNYLNSQSGWQAAQTSVHPANPTTGGAYDTYSTQFTVEDYATVQKPTTTVRIQIFNATTTVSYADAVYLIPRVSWGSIHGHNIATRSGLVLQSSPDNSAWTTRATFTIRKPSTYVTFAGLDYRYWKLLFSETNPEAILIGEAVLGEYQTLGTGPSYNLAFNFSDPQIRVPVRVGAPAVYQLSQFNQRRVPLRFRCSSKTAQQEILNLLELSRGGHPVVMVPHDGNSFTDAIYGRLSAEMPHSWETPTFVTVETELEEMAFPLITS